MPAPDDNVQVDLSTGNWFPLQTAQYREYGWRILGWIMWDPYALMTYASFHCQFQLLRVRLFGTRYSVSVRRFLFLRDMATLMLITWLGLGLLLLLSTLLTMPWMPPLSVLRILFYGTLLGVGTGLITLFAVSQLMDYATGTIWAFWAWLGLATLFCIEMSFRVAPEGFASWLYLLFCVVYGMLFGIAVNSVRHGMERNDCSLKKIEWILPAFTIIWTIGLLLNGAIVRDRVYPSWISVTLPAWILISGAILSALVAYLSYYRPVNFALGLFGSSTPPSDKPWTIPRVTPIPPPRVQTNMDSLFKGDWRDQLPNIEQMWQYSNLRDVTRQKMEYYLNNQIDTDAVVQRVSALVDDRFEWRLTDIFPELILKDSFWTSLRKWRPWPNRQIVAPLPSYRPFEQAFPKRKIEPENLQHSGFSSDAARTAAAFLFLEQQKFGAAADCFSGLAHSSSANELASMTYTIEYLFGIEEAVDAEKFPAPPLIARTRTRTQTWYALGEMEAALFHLWLRRRCTGLHAKTYTTGVVQNCLDNVERTNLLDPEARLFRILVAWWRSEFLKHNEPDNIGAVSVGVPDSVDYPPLLRVENPYRTPPTGTGKPYCIQRSELVTDYVGLIMSPDNLSLVLFGLPGIGLTTLFDQLGLRQPVAPISLKTVADQENAGYHLIRLIADAVTQRAGQGYQGRDIPESDWFQAFGEHTASAVRHCGGRLIIVIDDLERVVLMSAGARQSLEDAIDFMIELSSITDGLSIVFTGHFTPSEVNSIFGQHSDLSRRKVGFFEREEIEAFLIDSLPKHRFAFDNRAIDHIRTQTAGHPALVRLTGEFLIQRYNGALRRGKHHDPVFTVADIDAVTSNPDFQRRAGQRAYRPFEVIAQRVDVLADVLLAEIANYPGMRTDDDLVSMMGRTYQAAPVRIQEMLVNLESLDLIRRDQPRDNQSAWRLTIPTFQQYLSTRT